MNGEEPRTTGLTRNSRKGGQTIWCEWYHSCLLDDYGNIVSILSFVQDVSLRIQAEERLQHMATRDALTGLPNRVLLNERLAQASGGDPVLYLSNPRGVDSELQRDSLDSIRRLNQMRLDVTGDPEIATRINSFEMAFRMQRSTPELMDISKEPKPVLEMYGIEPGKPSFAYNCLLARRLVERGVRFVQLFHEAWDQHGNLVKDLRQNCLDTDQACAALIQDLKQRDMLKDTLVIWGGEFGRTPMMQGGNDGRDHHPNAFTMWVAGGGIKPGITLGETDELGFNVVKDRVHVHDLHATLLHLLGFDHTKLTHRFQGRDFRLTDVHGNIVKELLA